jgi:dynein heavy chain, axonemal
LNGDVFLASVELSYLGPFSGIYREELLAEWIKYAKDKGLYFSDKYSFVQTLGD